MFITVTALYAGLCALLFVGLGLRIPAMRRRLRINLGDGGDAAMLRAVRMHGNAAETIPLGLLLLAVIEISGASLWLLHAVGGSLLAGRVLHAAGLATSDGGSWPRVLGMVLTWLSMLIAAAYALLIAASSF